MRKEVLTIADVEKMLQQLSAAIEQDQIYVDGLPRDQFHPAYSPSLWHEWRQGHREFIKKLLATTNTMGDSHMRGLTEVASSFAPEIVGSVMLEFLADVVSGSVECEKADAFFARVAGEVVRQNGGKCHNLTARKAMMDWFPLVDPLQIARDPECGYSTGANFPQKGARLAP